MVKITFFAICALLVIVAATADNQEAVPVGQEENVEQYGWSCKLGGNAGCGASCAAQGHWKGGHCNGETCICN